MDSPAHKLNSLDLDSYSRLVLGKSGLFKVWSIATLWQNGAMSRKGSGMYLHPLLIRITFISILLECYWKVFFLARIPLAFLHDLHAKKRSGV